MAEKKIVITQEDITNGNVELDGVVIEFSCSTRATGSKGRFDELDKSAQDAILKTRPQDVKEVIKTVRDKDNKLVNKTVRMFYEDPSAPQNVKVTNFSFGDMVAACQKEWAVKYQDGHYRKGHGIVDGEFKEVPDVYKWATDNPDIECTYGELYPIRSVRGPRVVTEAQAKNAAQKYAPQRREGESDGAFLKRLEAWMQSGS